MSPPLYSDHVQELRTDDLTGAQVIVAPGRATRPEVFRSKPADGAVAGTGRGGTPESCPFCPGREAMTPPESARVGGGAPDTPGWQVRVVPNLYPIVGAEPGIPGAHEVVVISPAHDRELDELPFDEAVAAVRMLRDRAAHHLAAGLAHAQPILNHGRASGASIEHPHAQLIAVAVVPPLVDALLDRFAAARRDLVAAAIGEARGGGLVVTEDASVTWSPRGATSPFLMRIAIERSGARFDLATDAEVRDVTRGLQDALGRLRRVLGDVAYNVVVHTGPRDDIRPFHWWIDIVPRVAVVGGFELGTGFWVNAALPEAAAKALREA